MTEHDPLDPMDGEVGRALTRIETSVDALTREVRERAHALKNDMTLLIKPISTLEAQAANMDRQLERHDGEIKHLTLDVRAVEVRAAAISGGIAVLVGVIEVLLGFWKR
jgi:phage shock protein A